MNFVFLQKAFCGLEYAEMRLRLGLCPGPHWRAHDAPQTPSRLGSGHPSADPTPLGAFGRHLDPCASGARVCRRTHHFWLRHCLVAGLSGNLLAETGRQEEDGRRREAAEGHERTTGPNRVVSVFPP